MQPRDEPSLIGLRGRPIRCACRNGRIFAAQRRLFYRRARWHVRPVPVRIPPAAFDLAPPGTTIVRAERMSPAFVKYHLDDGRALHRFVRPEPHVHPHDHPWRFESTILTGGYVEEVFTLLPDGGWRSVLEARLPGSRRCVEARHIHRIVALPAGESWTIVRAGPHERKTLFWRFSETAQCRAWNSRRWNNALPRIVRSRGGHGRDQLR